MYVNSHEGYFLYHAGLLKFPVKQAMFYEMKSRITGYELPTR